MNELECVPNVSEGRRPEVVARLVTAVKRPGVAVLDVSSDPDHNRTVLTLAGTAPALHEALLGLYQVALAEIDLRHQEGVHPRVGAVDVVPFVPLGATPMAAAVAAAERLAEAVASRFELPVYLYEHAARRPERASLPVIRRGGLAGLAQRFAEPAWAPDFGPHRLHPTAGATIIGARFFLIAWNLLLDTADVEVARRIARAVRASSGGLPAVRAIGVHLASRGRAQVSLNLLDFRQTSLATAVAAVRTEAAKLGAKVVESELVGLLPREAAHASLSRDAALATLPSEAALAALGELVGLPGLGARHLLESRLEDRLARAERGDELPRQAVEGA